MIIRTFFINQRIEFYTNNTITLRPLTHALCHVIPTKWRPYRGCIFCDVISPYIFQSGANSSARTPFQVQYRRHASLPTASVNLPAMVKSPFSETLKYGKHRRRHHMNRVSNCCPYSTVGAAFYVKCCPKRFNHVQRNCSLHSQDAYWWTEHQLQRECVRVCQWY